MGGRRFAFILMLLGVVLIASVNGEKSTSSGCRVVQLGKKLQCRGAGLSKIPKIPSGILIVDLTDNLITHITQEDWKHLEKLQTVYLEGNPFHCDCNLEWLRLKLYNSPAVIQDGDSIQCATPSKIHSKPLKSLSNLCDVTEHEHSRPILSIQKRNAQPYIDKCKDMSCEAATICSKKGKRCDCPGGFKLDKVHRNCKDINECEKTPNICSGRYVLCTNTNGSYECNCKEGYYKTTDGCQDINECNTGAHKCDETTSKCQNTIGGHFCMCRTGFIKTQDKCVDIDECKANPDICGDKSATCKNTLGSYECICKNTGYKHNRIAHRCLDLDECVKKPCGDKNMICQNSQGSYSCDCKPHYRKDGNVCKDIDECADKSTVCEGDMKCINTLGSFKCECDHGFLPDAYRKCKDLDECKVRKHNCSKQSYCRNTLGSFKCVCPKGYEGDGVTKCSPNKLTRFTTPKYLLKDLVRGAWDSILVVLSAGVIGICLLVIIILTLKKMCLKCSKCGEEKELAQYQEQLFYHEEMYDPDQMFFPGADHEQMFYPEETGYPGDDVFYPEGMDYPEGTGYPDEAYYDDVTEPIPMTSVDPSHSVPHTYYGDDQDDEPSEDNAEGVPYEQY